MPAWNELLLELERQATDEAKYAWVSDHLQQALNGIRDRRGNRNVLFYASSFLQKPSAPPWLLQLTPEEINGFMSVLFGMKWDEHLTLLLHTPGGITSAAETVVEYLCSKFVDIEVIVPTFSMSAGTMIALGANRIIMGRQSQLGPIDPQIPIGHITVSARAIVDQFERAKQEILGNVTTAHAWAPILGTIGPALLQESQNALDYGEQMVCRWLTRRMFDGKDDAAERAAKAAAYFNAASVHKSHGRRIDRVEARDVAGIVVEDLEDDQRLQEHVLTAYHILTLIFEKGPASKMLVSHAKRTWVKNLSVGPQPTPAVPTKASD